MSRYTNVPSIERVKALLFYNPNTGIFNWIVDRSDSTTTSSEVGGLDKEGYRIIQIDLKKLRAHRLAFFYMTGRHPNLIDHINGNRDDNRWENLREVNKSENGMNRLKNKRNTSGLKGVNWHKGEGKWRACIGLNGNHKHLGFFTDPHEAHAKYIEAAIEHFGEYANDGTKSLSKV